jgi:membrane protein DedA with SNARE-associated domain
MTEWIKETIASLGYLAIVGLMFLENVLPPIPSELSMPLAGFMVAEGILLFVGVVLAGMIGSVLGALPLYYLGKLAGEQRLRAWTRKHGQWIALSERDVAKANAWFDEHGAMAVFSCRLVPGVRSLISIPAGCARMNFITFLASTALGTGLWAAVLASAGLLLKSHYEQVSAYLEPVAHVTLLTLAGAALLWIARRKR